jgi:hypothetical protein|tara:strand:- start:158 stop:361 length:204 start_codon:yes stop_codon:yes gene_type:complete
VKCGDLVEYVGDAILWMVAGDPTRQPTGYGIIVETVSDGTGDVCVFWSCEDMCFWHTKEDLRLINEM